MNEVLSPESSVPSEETAPSSPRRFGGVGYLRDLFLQARRPQPGPKRAFKVIAPAMKDKDGNVIRTELTGRPIGCAGCGKVGGTFIRKGDALAHKDCTPKQGVN
jgi:hypothetical protein